MVWMRVLQRRLGRVQRRMAEGVADGLPAKAIVDGSLRSLLSSEPVMCCAC